MEYLTKNQMDRLDVASLSNEKREKILSLKDTINMSDESIMEFGTSATKGMSEFSTTMLKTIKLKDFPEIDNIVGDLMTELSKVDSNTLLSYKPNLFQKIFGIGAIEKFVQEFASQFENVSDVINNIKKKLEDAKFQLKKDMTLCDKYMEQNLVHINDLDDCIFAGKLKLKEFHDEIEHDLEALDKEDTLAVHMLNMKQSAENRLEMNVRDLYLIRENAVQNMHQLRLIKEGDAVLIEKIKKSINMAIPLWESQMLVAFIIARQQNGVNLEKAISDTTNNLISMNSELVKSGAIKIAEELQRGIIDIDVLKASSQKLMETCHEVKKINMEGKQKRLAAIEELGQITVGLNEATLLED